MSTSKPMPYCNQWIRRRWNYTSKGKSVILSFTEFRHRLTSMPIFALASLLIIDITLQCHWPRHLLLITDGVDIAIAELRYYIFHNHTLLKPKIYCYAFTWCFLFLFGSPAPDASWYKCTRFLMGCFICALGSVFWPLLYYYSLFYQYIARDRKYCWLSVTYVCFHLMPLDDNQRRYGNDGKHIVRMKNSVYPL